MNLSGQQGLVFIIVMLSAHATLTKSFVTLRLGGSRGRASPEPTSDKEPSTNNKSSNDITDDDNTYASGAGSDEYFDLRQLHPNTLGKISKCPRVENMIMTGSATTCPRGWINAPQCDKPDHRNLGACEWVEDTEYEMPYKLAHFGALMCKSKRMKCLNEAGTIPGDTELLHVPRNSLSDKAELAETMSSLNKITVVDFARNDFWNLSPKTFASNPCLRLVNFDSNFLLDIPENLFYSNKMLTSVSFVGNKLDFLPPRLFFRNPVLTIVNFERNNITLLPQEVFRRNRRLEVVRLAGNSLPNIPIGLFSTNPYLREVGLAHNRISVVPKFLFHNSRNLRELSLSGNKIKALPANLFDNCKELRSLNLDRNLITNLPARLFERVSKLLHLDISHNRFITVDSKFFSSHPMVSVVNKQWGSRRGILEEEKKDRSWSTENFNSLSLIKRKHQVFAK